MEKDSEKRDAVDDNVRSSGKREREREMQPGTVGGNRKKRKLGGK